MTQNVYDNPDFFGKYSRLDRSVNGLDGNMEWPDFRAMLPDLHGARMLDLGCGFGDICRYASWQGAESVVGIDLSGKMLEEAKRRTQESNIVYQQGSMEDLPFEPGSFDIVVSSLALHYVERFDLLCREIATILVPGGTFAASFEHPIFTARAEQDWYFEVGKRRHWPVDDYNREGPRATHFLDGDVVKFHRTAATYINNLIGAGLRISKVVEPKPDATMLEKHPDWVDEIRRPIFMLISAIKPEL